MAIKGVKLLKALSFIKEYSKTSQKYVLKKLEPETQLTLSTSFLWERKGPERNL